MAISYLFSDMQNKLSSLLGDENTGTENQFPLAVRKKELNMAELAFAQDSRAAIEYTSGTISGMAISLPASWLSTIVLLVNSVDITNNREVSIQDLGRLKNYSGDTPYFYLWKLSGTWTITFLGNSTNINGETYELFFAKKPTTEMDVDSDESIFDVEYREAIPYKAAYELLLQVGKVSKASAYKSMYDAMVKKAMDDVSNRIITRRMPNPDINYFPSDATTDVAGQ